MTQGTKADTKMMAALAPRPMPNHRIIRGIQAMVGTGRIRSNSGVTNRSTLWNQAMAMPRGTPTTTPST